MRVVAVKTVVCEVLPEHGSSGSMETVKDLKLGVELTSSTCGRQRPYSVSDDIKYTSCDELKKTKKPEIVSKSNSPYASAVDIAKKKDIFNRVWIDFQWLNKLTVFDPHPKISPADVLNGI
ncbi:Zinc finger protein [Plakobranchus ocellatus]|uniref:Zinc finger protein n=1 Tax=Plakobranchus ocellatus TaxID=259542 RepID=A0AAV4AA78_9GAST|nr:Zinc finger protein [Plakobranchus ocellatus]